VARAWQEFEVKCCKKLFSLLLEKVNFNPYVTRQIYKFGNISFFLAKLRSSC
jgi:hypothetical protein